MVSSRQSPRLNTNSTRTWRKYFTYLYKIRDRLKSRVWISQSNQQLLSSGPCGGKGVQEVRQHSPRGAGQRHRCGRNSRGLVPRREASCAKLNVKPVTTLRTVAVDGIFARGDGADKCIAAELGLAHLAGPRVIRNTPERMVVRRDAALKVSVVCVDMGIKRRRLALTWAGKLTMGDGMVSARAVRSARMVRSSISRAVSRVASSATGVPFAVSRVQWLGRDWVHALATGGTRHGRATTRECATIAYAREHEQSARACAQATTPKASSLPSFCQHWRAACSSWPRCARSM